MASSESEDNQIFIKASQQYEDITHENIEDDSIHLEASQQFEAEFAEQYVKDHRKYEHMDEEDLGIDKLMPQTSQPQRFGPLEASQQFEVEFVEQYVKDRR